jgi:hypothetical protein
MSLVPDKLDVTLVDDPRLVFDKWAIPARIGGDAISYNSVSVPSPSGNINFAINPSNPSGAVVAPTLIWHTRTVFNINVGVGGVGNLCIQGFSDAPRAYPMTSCCQSITITINGTPVSFTNLNMIGHALRRFNPRASMYKAANFCPWYPDSGCVNYGDLVLTNRNPLGAGGVGDLDFTRGSYQRVTYVAGADPTTQCTVTLDTYEPVNLSPFMFDMHQQGLPYVQNMSVEFNLTGSLARALSHAVVAGQNVAIPNSAITDAVIQSSTLYYQQINLPKFAREIKPSVNLPCYKLQTNSTQINSGWSNGVPALGTVPAGTACQSQIIQLNCIPSRIYVFAQPDQASLTMQDPDFTFMFCGNFSIQWGVNTYMQNMRPEQFYASAVDAGYAFPWENFGGSYLLGEVADLVPTVVGSSGSVLCIRPGIDFPLEAGQAVGQQGKFTFQVTGNFHEQRTTVANSTASLWTVAVLPSVLTLTSSYACSVITGPITGDDVLDAGDKENGAVISASEVHNAFGSGIFDSIKSALPYVRKLGKYAHAGLAAADKAGLLGEGVMSGGSALSGGSSLYGGARLTAADLRARRR